MTRPSSMAAPSPHRCHPSSAILPPPSTSPSTRRSGKDTDIQNQQNTPSVLPPSSMAAPSPHRCQRTSALLPLPLAQALARDEAERHRYTESTKHPQHDTPLLNGSPQPTPLPPELRPPTPTPSLSPSTRRTGKDTGIQNQQNTPNMTPPSTMAAPSPHCCHPSPALLPLPLAQALARDEAEKTQIYKINKTPPT